MPSATLSINSRNYGAWSLRGWLMCRLAGLEFEVDERSAQDPSQRDELLLMSPSFLVPCLTVDDLEIWDTLAIGEYLAERFPEHAVPQEVRPIFLEAGHVAESLVTKAGTVIAKRDVEAARELEEEDDVMDRLHKQLFRELLLPSWGHGIESAIDVTLLGRYYERFADHAVSVARRVVYLVTGERHSPLSSLSE